jgi:hypothetical protein
MAAFSSPFRLYRRQEIILQGGNMKTMLIAGVSLMTSLAMAQSTGTTYSVQDLGIAGGSPVAPYFMTTNGLIAGAAATANNQSHAAVWFMGFHLDLSTPGLGGENSFADSVNNKGQVVGGAETAVANSEDFCGFNANGAAKSSQACLPFVFQNGVMTQLPTLGGPNGIANWINNRGEAVGWAETINKDPTPGCGVLQFQPVLWGTTSTRTLPVFPGDSDGFAYSINDLGQVVGASGPCTAFNANLGVYMAPKHAMLWEGGAAINLGNLGGDGLGHQQQRPGCGPFRSDGRHDVSHLSVDLGNRNERPWYAAGRFRQYGDLAQRSRRHRRSIVRFEFQSTGVCLEQRLDDRSQRSADVESAENISAAGEFD